MLTDSNNKQHVFAREVKQAITAIKSKYLNTNVSYLDLLSGETGQSFQEKAGDKSELQCVFAFSIGGGSFHEYESFKTVIEQLDQEEDQRDNTLATCKVVYGCDHIFRPNDFLDEILKLN